MDLTKAPRSIVVVLSLMAAISFAAGVWLEFAHRGELQNHPYFSNLLSGVTGFSTSALAAVVVLNVVVHKARNKRWGVQMVRSLQAAASSAEGIANVLATLVGEPPLGNADWMQDDLLTGLVRLATEIRSRSRNLDPNIAPQPEDWQTLIRRVTRFTAYVMPRIEPAFNLGEDPKIVAPLQDVENDLGMLGHLGGYGTYGNTRQNHTAQRMCARLADLLEAIAQNSSVVADYREAAANLPNELRLSEI